MQCFPTGWETLQVPCSAGDPRDLADFYVNLIQVGVIWEEVPLSEKMPSTLHWSVKHFLDWAKNG